jgi:hypothetical protein
MQVFKNIFYKTTCPTQPNPKLIIMPALSSNYYQILKQIKSYIISIFGTFLVYGTPKNLPIFLGT